MLFVVYAYLCGYAFSLFAPLYPLKWISVNLWLALAIDAGIPKDAAVDEHRVDLPLLIGLLERFIYTAAFVSDRDSLVGVWLALKVIGSWKRWSDGFTDNKSGAHVSGRNVSNVFILGSGLSLVGAWVGAQIIEWIKANQLWESVLGGVTYLLALLAIAGYAKYIVKK